MKYLNVNIAMFHHLHYHSNVEQINHQHYQQLNHHYHPDDVGILLYFVIIVPE